MTWLDDAVVHYRSPDETICMYGVLLYTDAHPHIKKVINDDDYWKEFDEISGERWVVFSIRADQGNLKQQNARGNIQFFEPIWDEPAANKELIDVFELPSTEHLPLLAVFFEGRDGLYKNLIQLDDSSQQNAHNSIKRSVKTVSQALDDVLEENLGNADGVIAALELAIQHDRDWRYIENIFRIWEKIKSLR